MPLFSQPAAAGPMPTGAADVPAAGAPEVAAARVRPAGQILLAALVVALVPLFYLLSPPPTRAEQATRCVSTLHLAGPANIVLNCDSYEFAVVARDPSLLLTPAHKLRQARPLYAVAGWVFGLPFRAAGVDRIAARVLGPSRAEFAAAAPEFAGFILLNGLLLVLALEVFRRTLGGARYSAAWMILPATLLAVNEVTKAFFWSPHQQLLNVLIPVGAIALYAWMQPRLGALGWPRMAAIGVAIGLCELMYGAFAIVAAGAALLCLADRASGVPLGRRLVRAAALLAAS
ncbi:MAG TPA: hypothetical protein VJT67_04800, partial [Longimicrobiaceae bacterium]|nr:hypothetical protein [Longimicrobiaceae bacterium]